jgi:hypothetical protein
MGATSERTWLRRRSSPRRPLTALRMACYEARPGGGLPRCRFMRATKRCDFTDRSKSSVAVCAAAEAGDTGRCSSRREQRQSPPTGASATFRAFRLGSCTTRLRACQFLRAGVR